MIQIIVATLMVVATLLVRSLTIQMLWGWFVCQQFSLPALTFPTAMGLSLLISVIIQNRYYLKSELDEMKDNSSEEDMYTSIHNTLLQVGSFLIILLVGWAIHSWL